jgi:hypothetical protein
MGLVYIGLCLATRVTVYQCTVVVRNVSSSFRQLTNSKENLTIEKFYLLGYNAV